MKRPQLGAKKIAADCFTREAVAEAKGTRRRFLDELEIARSTQDGHEKLWLHANDRR